MSLEPAVAGERPERSRWLLQKAAAGRAQLRIAVAEVTTRKLRRGRDGPGSGNAQALADADIVRGEAVGFFKRSDAGAVFLTECP